VQLRYFAKSRGRESFKEFSNADDHSSWGKPYQVLYAVPSNCEVFPEFECTSTIPVVT